jgi:hypothetical protein
MKRNRKRYALAALLAFVVATSGYAFAATNTVGTSNAGDGSATVSPFTVSAIKWTLNASDPTKIGGLSFTISPAATAVRVGVDVGAGSTSWLAASDCTVSSGTSVSCTPTTSVGTQALVGLRVAAVS